MKESIEVKANLYFGHLKPSEEILEFFKELSLSFELCDARDSRNSKNALGVFPMIELKKEGSGKIRYYGYPEGLERKVIAEIVKILKNEESFEEDVVEKSELIKKASAEFTIFVTPFCLHCSKVVKKLLQFAIMNPEVEVNIIDVSQFKELREKFGIVSVPVILVDQKIRITGEKSLEELMDLAEKSNDPEYISEYIVEMIKDGKAGELSQTILNVELDKVLPRLFKEDDFFLRLGVMYLLEELSEKNRDLGDLRLKIMGLLWDDDPRVREDAIMALGKIGGESELKILEELLIEESGEIKEAVVEAIEEIRERLG